MLFSSFSTRSMVFAYFAKAQLPFSLFRDLFNDTAEFTLCYGLHDCSPLFQGYFIHSLSTLYYYNAPSLATRLTGDYRDRTYTGKCSPALLDTRKKERADNPRPKANGLSALRLMRLALCYIFYRIVLIVNSLLFFKADNSRSIYNKILCSVINIHLLNSSIYCDFIRYILYFLSVAFLQITVCICRYK